MDTLIRKNIVQELDKNSKKNINGGGPITEGIAWLYGFAHGRLEKMANTEITNEHRVLVGG